MKQALLFFLLNSAFQNRYANECFISFSPATVGTCGCDYFYMCNPTATVKIGTETFYGLNGSEKQEIFYQCKNGVVTMAWYTYNEVLAESRWEWRHDINDYGYVDYYDNERVVNKRIILKTAVPVGTTWSVATGDGDFVRVYKIESKGQKMVVNGKQYNDVLKLSVTTKMPMDRDTYASQQDAYNIHTGKYIFQNTFHNNGSVYKNALVYYYDRNDGLLKEEDVFADLKAKSEGKLEGIKNPSQQEADLVMANNRKTPVKQEVTKPSTTTVGDEVTNMLIKNVWMSDFFTKAVGFEKSGIYTYVKGLASGEQERGTWRLNGSWIEINMQKQSPVWKKVFEIVKTPEGNYVLKGMGEVFQPQSLPE